ncbi:hypothetical protein L210DRAFT_3568772 [Boletus edulis BED1]|uniref:Uncharacterized protein n=1 Tax=Boletus edulis BED1 TaxID=1328754 RepID=A0AAD4BF71_BOLED|nr:hypothetical protein L210DRAFT_3568772 [Boletus edulis BED1]
MMGFSLADHASRDSQKSPQDVQVCKLSKVVISLVHLPPLHRILHDCNHPFTYANLLFLNWTTN